MKKQGSGVEERSAVTEVVIKTTDQDGLNVVNIFLKVTEDGEIAEMFGEDGKKRRWAMKKIKFTLNRKTDDDDNNECKCCALKGDRIVCVTCPCEN